MSHSTPKTEIEGLLSADERRDRFPNFREFITPPPAPAWDAIDELVEQLRAAEFEERGSR